MTEFQVSWETENKIVRRIRSGELRTVSGLPEVLRNETCGYLGTVLGRLYDDASVMYHVRYGLAIDRPRVYRILVELAGGDHTDRFRVLVTRLAHEARAEAREYWGVAPPEPGAKRDCLPQR